MTTATAPVDGPEHTPPADAPGPGSTTAGAVLAGLVVLVVGSFFCLSLIAVGQRWANNASFSSPARRVSISGTGEPPTNPSFASRQGEVDPKGYKTGRLRSGPSVNSSIVLEVPAGRQVAILEDRVVAGATWYRVRVGGTEGWMHGEIVRLSP